MLESGPGQLLVSLSRRSLGGPRVTQPEVNFKLNRAAVTVRHRRAGRFDWAQAAERLGLRAASLTWTRD